MSDAQREEWDFYACTVDDAPASILLDLAIRERAPLPGLDHLYWVVIELGDPGDHGMGTPGEAALLHDLEDALVDRAASLSLAYVGRLRNHGEWQITFFGPPDRIASLEDVAASVIADRRAFHVDAREDETWSYYFEFLFPDPERLQWIMNRRVIQSLAESGDDADAPRTIEHFVSVPEAAARIAFATWARANGFTVAQADGANPSMLRVEHVAPARLDLVHDVVMDLVEAATQHRGEYDGWGCSVVKRKS